MKKEPVVFDQVVHIDDPNVGDKIAEFIGAKPGDTIEIVTPQFTRQKNMPAPKAAPRGLPAWEALRSKSVEELSAMGFGSWDGGLMLIPGEWFAAVPKRFEVECISGDISAWGDEARDDDIRFGCLAYGIRVGPATDGCDE